MLQQVKQIEEFFRNEEMASGLSALSYDINGDTATDSHSSKEAELLKKEIKSLQEELRGLLLSAPPASSRRRLEDYDK